MPQLPQIGPDISVRPAGIVPVRPGQADTAVASAGQELSDKSLALARQITEIDRYNQFHAGNADFINGEAQLDLTTRKITDPEKRLQTYTAGLQALQKQIIAKYPHAGPEFAEQLADRVAYGTKRASEASIAQMHANNIANLTTNGKATAVAFANARDHGQAAGILQDYNTTVDIALQKGAISEGEANKFKYAAKYGAQVASFAKLVNTDPVTAMSIPLEKSGLNEQDYFAMQSRAQRQENRDNGIADDEWKAKRNTAMQGVLDGTSSDEKVAEDYHFGLVPEPLYENRFGHKPFDAGAAAHVMSQLEGTDASGASMDSTYAMDHWLAHYMEYQAPYLDPNTNKAVLANWKAKRGDVATEEGKIKSDIVNEGTALLRDKHEMAFGRIPDQDDLTAYKKEVGQLKSSVKAAKTPEDAQKILDDMKKTTATRAPDAPGKPSLADLIHKTMGE